MEIKIEPMSNKSMREVEESKTPWIVRTIFSIILTLVKLTGLVPFTLCLETKSVDFKLLSWRTFFAFLRLVVFTFPFILLPFIFYVGGFVEKAASDAVLAASSANGTFYETSFIGKSVAAIEQYVTFLVYILPFAFAYFLAKPLESIYRIRTAEQNLNLEKSRLAVKGAVFPIFGFVLFFVGKLMHTTTYLNWCYDIEGFSKYHFYIYNSLSNLILGDFPLHFLLATYEYFFYRNMPSYESLAKRVLKTEDPRLLLDRTKELTVFMKNTQDGYGFFLLVDLTLMLLYWLIHTFKAYFTFQVNHKKLAFLTFSAVGHQRHYFLPPDHLGRALQGPVDL